MKSVRQHLFAFVFAVLAYAAPPVVAGEKVYAFFVPESTVDIALNLIAQQANTQVLFPFDKVRSIEANAVSGEYTLARVLGLALNGTSLSASFTNSGVIQIVFHSEQSKLNHEKGKSMKKSTLSAGILALVSAFFGLGAKADTATDQTGNAIEEEIEEVVVTGTRLQNRLDIALKKDSLVTYDSLSAEEIGQAPDFNIADAFRRIPGVSSLFDEDEGRFVTVRGINPDLNFATLNGLVLATIGGFGDGSRRVNLEVIPSTAVSRVEIYKTFTPDIDVGAVGGYLNLVTRSAFEKNRFFFSADLAVTEHNFNDIDSEFAFVDVGDDEPGGRAQFSVGDVFGADDQFGYVMAASWRRKHRDEEKVINGNRRFFDETGDSVGPEDAVISTPDVLRWLSYNNEVERTGFSGKLEFRTAKLYTSLSGYYFTQGEDETRYDNRIEVRGDAISQTNTTAEFGGVRARIGWNYNELDRENSGIQWHLNYDIDEDRLLTIAVGRSTASFEDIGVPVIDLRASAARDVRLTIDTSGFTATHQLSDNSLLTDASLYRVRQYREVSRDSEEDATEFKIDFAFNYGSKTEGFGYKIGAGYREFDRTRDHDRLIIADNVPIRDLTAAGFIARNGYTSRTQTAPFNHVDFDAFARAIQPFAAPFRQDSTTLGEDFRFVEETTYVYGLLSYATDKYRITGGLRFDDTEFNADNFRRVEQPGPDPYVPVKNSGGYDNLLPSLHFTYNVTEDLRLRASYSETLGRPNPDQIATSERIKEDAVPLPTIKRGNPNLQPRQVKNYDASVEYYFDKGDSIFSVGIFRKNLKDDIFIGSTMEVLGGEEFLVTQPLNATTSEIQGLEANFVMNSLHFLPAPLDDLGITANFTVAEGQLNFVNGDEKGRLDQLLEQPETQGNIRLFYHWNRLEARLSYNLQGKYLARIDLGRPDRNRFVDTYEQVDFRIRYKFSNGIKAYFDVRNLTDQRRIFLAGPENKDLFEAVEFGRVLIFGFSYYFKGKR